MANWRDLGRLGWVAAVMMQGERAIGVHLMKTREGVATPSIDGLRANGFLRKKNGEWVTGRTAVRWEAVFPELNALFDRARTTPVKQYPIAVQITERAQQAPDYEFGEAKDPVFGTVSDQTAVDFNERALHRLIGVSADSEQDVEVIAERLRAALPEGDRVESFDTSRDWAAIIRAAMGDADAVVISGISGQVFVPPFVLARAELILSGEIQPARHPDTDAQIAKEAMQRTLLDRTSAIRAALLRQGWARSDAMYGALEKVAPRGAMYRLNFDLTMSREERLNPPEDATNFTFMVDILWPDGRVEEFADLPHDFSSDLGVLTRVINEATPVAPNPAHAESENARSLIQSSGQAPYEAEIITALEAEGGYAAWAAKPERQDVADSLMSERLSRIRSAFLRLNEAQGLEAGWHPLAGEPSTVALETAANRYRVEIDASVSASRHNLTDFALNLRQATPTEEGRVRWPLMQSFANDMKRTAEEMVGAIWAEVSARELARTNDVALEVGTQDEPPPKTTRSSAAISSDRIEDVGEKIGGARKDKYQGFGDFRFEDFKVKADEIDALFDYKKVWPFSISGIKAAGGDAIAAAQIKALRSRVRMPSEVLRRTSLTVKDYVGAVERLRDAFGEVTTHDEFVTAARALHEWCGSDEAWVPSGPQSRQATPEYFALNMTLNGAERALGLSAQNWRSPSAVRLTLLQRSYRFTNEDGTPRNDDDAWKWLLPTRVQATNEISDGEPVVPSDRDLVADKCYREGVDWRDGRDVPAEELLSEFGFRGIEFGNWVSQRERQEVVNAAYDAFCDMSEVLGIDRRYVGFDGRLGLAFGARGQGKAAAHFEPSFNVINLTKSRGGGWLAHEWGHALDCYAAQPQKGFASEHGMAFPGMPNPNWLAQRADLGEADEATLACYKANVETKLAHSRDVIVSWVSGLLGRRMRIGMGTVSWESAKERAMQFMSDAFAAADEFKETATDHEMERAFTSALENFIRLEVPVSDEALKRADAAHIRDLRKTERDAWKNIALAFAWRQRHAPQLKLFSMTQAELRNELEKARVELAELWKERWPAGEADRAIAATRHVLRAYNVDNVDIPTGYRAEAALLDAGRAKKYWSTPWEMFARAFEAYVYDALQANGGCNSYLVSDQKADGYFSDAKWKANPYPSADERRTLNRIMHDYLATLTARMGMACTARRDANLSASAHQMRL